MSRRPTGGIEELAAGKITSDPVQVEQQLRQTNSLRFAWHEHVLKDSRVRKQPNALAIAGYLMHRFNPKQGHAEISAESITRDLGIPDGSAKRSLKYLRRRGWMIVKEPYRPSPYWRGTRYSLGGGPQDLLLDDHDGGTGESSGEGA